MLTVGVETGGGAEDGFGYGGTCVTEGTGDADDGDCCKRGDTEFHAKRHINSGNQGNGGKRGTNTHSDDQTDQQHEKNGKTALISDSGRGKFHQFFVTSAKPLAAIMMIPIPPIM